MIIFLRFLPCGSSLVHEFNDTVSILSFRINYATQSCTCPAGNPNVAWCPKTDHRGYPVIEVRFAAMKCKVCPLRSQYTRAKHAPRLLKLRPLLQLIHWFTDTAKLAVVKAVAQYLQVW
ncbi:transposase [Nostoc sp.]|uniref:transposase n=1 Tax=Nostoc sp. TaxID=1180 RepID=UPI003FA5F0E1